MKLRLIGAGCLSIVATLSALGAPSAEFAGYPMLDAIVVTVTDKRDPKPSTPVITYTCYVLIAVLSTGRVQGAQVIKSNGSHHLDDACIKAILNKTMTPAMQGGIPYDAWVVLPIEWRLASMYAHPEPVPPSGPIPVLAHGQQLNLSIAPARDGRCGAHVLVSSGGAAEQVDVIHSTGDPAMDQACTTTLRSLKFVPVERDGHTVTGATTIWLSWPPATLPSQAGIPEPAP